MNGFLCTYPLLNMGTPIKFHKITSQYPYKTTSCIEIVQSIEIPTPNSTGNRQNSAKNAVLKNTAKPQKNKHLNY